MRIIAFVTDNGSITRILAYLGEPIQTLHIARRPSGPPQLSTPPGTGPLSDRQITAQPVRPSILHCKHALNLLSLSFRV